MNDQAKQLRDLVSKNKLKTDAPQSYNEPAKQNKMKVITITSGKGGVGKSNFTTNLALCLKDQGKNPLILDADFGLANVEIIFGERPKYNLGHLVKGECTLNELITNSKYDIPFISGGSGVKEMLFLEEAQLQKISEDLKGLEDLTDMLLIDTGAGINDVVVKFSLIADEIYVIVTPEPASMTDAYALIKTLVTDFNMKPKFKIIINKAMNRNEAHQVFSKIAYACKYFLQLPIEYVGFIPYDEKMFVAVKKQQPIYNYDKKSHASQAYYQISKQFISDIDSLQEERVTEKSWLDKFKNIFQKH